MVRRGNRIPFLMAVLTIALLMALFLIVVAHATTPVSAPASRFVWEPGENLTLAWTPANFDGFYYDADNNAGNESLTIKLDNIKDRTIPYNGIVYSTTAGTATARYRPFGEYAVIGFMGEKYLAGYPKGKSNITTTSGINLSSLHKILIDERASYTLVRGSNLAMSDGYVLEIRDVNVTGAEVTFSLKKDGIGVDTKTVDAGKNYIYEIQDQPVIAVHVDSVFEEKETVSVTIKGIFQVSDYYTPVNKGDIFGVMKVTKVSDTGITMRNTAVPVGLKPGRIIEIIGGIKLKVADSNTFRVHLFYDWYNEKNERRGATGSNDLTAWDGLNYAGFWYDIDSGNYSEALEITNMSGRRIPAGGLSYTSYKIRVPYAYTKIKGKKPPAVDGQYIMFSLGGIKYAVQNDGLARILIAHGDSFYDKKTLVDGETWELGEGYDLTVKSIDAASSPRTARLVLRRNGVELNDVLLMSENVSKYAVPGENGTPKFSTYLDAVFAGATIDMIQLRYTWFVSDNVTQIKEGDKLGVFNVTVVEPERIVLKNRKPIDLKAGSSINLFGNLSFFVENSDELRFYPTSMAGKQVTLEEVTVEAMPDIPDATATVTTIPAEKQAEKATGFEVVTAIAALLAVSISGCKKRRT
ncbi:S-layer protein [uncultured archaeon]|nr:S-layer protein [uncultured archaeon]